MLDRLASSKLSVAPLGEIVNFWGHGLQQNRLCSCGSTFRDCFFWRETAARVSPAQDPSKAKAIVSFQEEVLRSRHLWRLLGAAFRKSTLEAPRYYFLGLRELYESIAVAQGSSIIVDSSKHPMYLWYLANVPGLRLRVIHCVRDPRAVAYSWGRDKSEPGLGPAGRMHKYSPTMAALLWDLWNISTAKVCHVANLDAVTLRYEDLVAGPVEALSSCLNRLGVVTSHVYGPGDHKDAPRTHMISGNPSRFGNLDAVMLDDEWRTSMPMIRRATVSVCCAPWSKRWGYPWWERSD